MSRAHTRYQTTWIGIIDFVCLVLGCCLGLTWRIPQEEWLLYFTNHTTNWFVLVGSILLANYITGSYRIQYTYSRFNLVVTWLFSIVFAIMLMNITAYLRMIHPLGRGIMWRAVMVYGLLILTIKLTIYKRLFRAEAFICRTVIIGSGKSALRLRDVVEGEYVMPRHKVVAFLDVDKTGAVTGLPRVIDGVAVLKSTENTLEEVIKSLGVDLIILGLENIEDAVLYYPRLRKLRFHGIEVLTPQNVYEVYAGKTPVELMDEDLLMQVSMQSGLPDIYHLKRLTDIIASGLGLIIAVPLILIVAAITKLSSPRSPVFYVQDRVGQFGKIFRIYKIRTMREGAEDETGPVWAGQDDPRITRLGRVLRRFRFDEIPQLVNIFKGDMSIVGPRPERPQIVAELASQIPFYSERENVCPGLTGWAQVRYPYGNTVEDTKRKLEFDLYYIKNLSLSLDLQIILSTIRIVLFGMERKQ